MSAGDSQLNASVDISIFRTTINLFNNSVRLTAKYDICTAFHFCILTSTIDLADIQGTLASVIIDIYICTARNITLGITATVCLMNSTTSQEHLRNTVHIGTRIIVGSSRIVTSCTITATKHSTNLVCALYVNLGLWHIGTIATAIHLVDAYITGLDNHLGCLTISRITCFVTTTIDSRQIICTIIFICGTHICSSSDSFIDMNFHITSS